MTTVLALFLFLALIWTFFLLYRRPINIILSWILSEVIKKVFPQEDINIEVDDFGYFCVKGVHISLKNKPLVSISQIVLQFVWDESLFGLKLQSTISDLILERDIETANRENKRPNGCDDENVEIKGSVTVGINLFSLDSPTELLKIAPETECVHGSGVKISDLTSVWLFGKNGEALIQRKNKNGHDRDVFYKLWMSEAEALVLYNSRMARLVVLFKDAKITHSPILDKSPSNSESQIATSEGLILMYKFVDGVLTSSHSRLKHTEFVLTPLAISTLETLVDDYVEQDVHGSRPSEESVLEEPSEKICENDNSSMDGKNKCEVAFEVESITSDIFSHEKSNHLQLKLAVFGLGRPEENMTRWSISIPFELTFFNAQMEVKESVLGSKIKSEGSINPCVLKVQGEEIINNATKWNISFNESILVQIKPQYVNTLESFLKAYTSTVSRSQPNVVSQESLERPNLSSFPNDFKDRKTAEANPNENDKVVVRSKRGRFEISASICEITIDVLDVSDNNLLQVTMLSPKFSMSQDLEKRSLSFSIATLKGFNSLENIPFFHPTENCDDGEDVSSLALSVVEELSNDKNKVSYKKFIFGSCDTTVIVEETLIFAVLKNFGLHKKVAEIFFERRGEGSSGKTDFFSQRFYFDNLELRSVEVILTLLPAIELPVDLQVIKNNLGIPHQLPPRFENASLNFGAFVRSNIQYGSYKYISNDIKKHYLKELGSQSARVLGSMHLLGNISRLKEDIMSGFTTLRETGEFITFFRQVTSGVASSYSKFTGSWSDLFGMNYSTRCVRDTRSHHERRHSDPSELDVATLRQISEEYSSNFQRSSTPVRKAKDDTSVVHDVEDSEGIWLNSSMLPDVTSQTENLNWDDESGSSDGEGSVIIPLDLIPRNVKRQLKGQEFLRRLKENLGDNEHGEVFACCFKIRKNDLETKLNALLTNRKAYFLKDRPSHESLVLCVRYETLYKAQYIFQDRSHYLQLVSKMKGIKALSIPTRYPSESPLVRCDNMVIARKVAVKINELKKAYDHECLHTQHQ